MWVLGVYGTLESVDEAVCVQNVQLLALSPALQYHQQVRVKSQSYYPATLDAFRTGQRSDRHADSSR